MCECYTIGGPWIGADPFCPAHGDEAQRERRETEERFDRLETQVSDLRKGLELAKRIIEHYGANHTESGKPHPQAQALAELTAILEKTA